jgi:hypothetical protein
VDAGSPTRICANQSLRALRGLAVALSLTLAAAAGAAFAQSGGFKVIVGGDTYTVRGAKVADARGGEPDNATVVENARFTARVLDEHILRSEQNKVRYSASSRAIIFADATPARMTAPWLQGAAEGPGDLAAEKERFTEWVLKLADNPTDRALAVARMDYVAGVRAYRENAVIWRKVTVKKELLTYEDALTFYNNQQRVMRIGEARKLEARLAAGAGARDRGDGPGRDVAQNGSDDQNRNGAQTGNGSAQNGNGSTQNGGGSAQQQGGGGTGGGQDPQRSTGDQLRDVAAQVGPSVQSHSDLEASADQVRDIATAPASTGGGGAMQDYVAADRSARSEYQREEQNYRDAQLSGGDSPASGGGPTFDFSGWRFPSILPPRYAARPSPPRQAQPYQPPRQGPRPGGGGSTNSGSTITGTSDNGSSTITGGTYGQTTETRITSSYRNVSQERASQIIKTYKSIPGGITLEGEASLAARIRSASYEPAANAIILDNDLVYLSPVSAPELADILRAIAADTSMGVSLAAGSSLVYGRLPPQGLVAMNLKLADHFLGGITFARRDELADYKFAPGYPGRSPTSSNGNLAVYFNFNEFRFAEDATGEIRRTGSGLDITLVPLSEQKGADGGHVPDYDRIKKGDVPAEYVENATHLQDNVDYYARERIVRITFAYGEIAALARTMRAQGVDLQQLARAIDPGGSIPDAPTTQAAPPTDTSAALPSHLSTRPQAQPQQQRPKQQAARPKTARVAQDGGGGTGGGGTRGDPGVCGLVRAYLGTAIAHGLDNRDGAITAARRACR